MVVARASKCRQYGNVIPDDLYDDESVRGVFFPPQVHLRQK
jgi:hypothetical protein